MFSRQLELGLLDVKETENGPSRLGLERLRLATSSGYCACDSMCVFVVQIVSVVIPSLGFDEQHLASFVCVSLPKVLNGLCQRDAQ